MSQVRGSDPAGGPLVGGSCWPISPIGCRVGFMREHYGRGPIKAKTYVLDNLIVCVLSDGFTAIERTMMEKRDKLDRVLGMRARLPTE